MEDFQDTAVSFWTTTLDRLSSFEFYLQVGVVAGALILAYLLSLTVRTRVKLLRSEPQPGPMLDVRMLLYRAQALLFPLFCALLLGIATQISLDAVGRNWLVRIFQGISFIYLAYSFVHHIARNVIIVRFATWLGLPIAMLYVLGWLDDTIRYLDGISLELGDFRISAYALARTVIFGIILFWLGRISSNTGTRVIRNQAGFDASTREVIAKLFQIGLFVAIALVLLQVMGINLTALAVFGGAVGVGLGFGLQQIAANFISGIIILLDRSLTIGDYIELEDGKTGRLRELTMRSGVLETFDGKHVMVPNEKFITTTFVNWTHYNEKQRYSLYFSVAYSTDLEAMFPIVRDIVASHPKVLSGDDIPIEERPDAEISSFGDSGIEILVEFWMEGIDDGENRVGADLLMMIWTALRANGIEIPFPQREVRILGDKAGADKAS